MGSSATRHRIAYVVHTLNAGGTERLAVDMALEFHRDHDVQVVCLDEPGTWAQGLRDNGIPVHCLWRQPGFDPMTALRLARLLRRQRIDLVHAHQCTPWFYSALSRLFHHAPRLLLEEHGRFYPEVLKPLRICVNRMLIGPLTHAMVAVSADIRRRLAEFEGLREQRIRVIYNGVQPLPPANAEERAAVRRDLGLNVDDFVVGTVGRLDPIKNVPMLLRAFKVAISHAPGIRLVIVGDGPEREAVERLTGELDIAERVRLTGFRSDARRVMTAFDLFAMASLSEGTSMALLEAMSAGIPVAVTAVGGNPEILTDGVNGRLVPSENIDALAAAICSLHDDRSLSARLALEASHTFERRFSFDSMLRSYSQLYGELLGAAA